MPTHHDEIAVIEQRLSALEQKVKEEQDELKPMLMLFHLGKLLGRVILILIGAATGIITLYTAAGDFFGRHFK